MASLIDEIAQLADELAQPHVHAEPYRTWKSRNRKDRLHYTTHPGLLEQLRLRAVDPSKLLNDVGGGASKKPASRPPLAIEAFSRWIDIRHAVAEWGFALGIDYEPVPEEGILALSKVAITQTETTVQAITRDMRQWRRWCAVMTGWESKVFSPAINCPSCTSFRSIRINSSVGIGFCCECQHSWETITDLLSLGKSAQNTPSPAIA